MIEDAFLTAVTSFLETPGTLIPAPNSLGVIEPAVAADLPAVVLSLSGLSRPSSGLGERSDLMVGALSWTVSIDLEQPFLPSDPLFRLLSPDRKTLALPHGGLVRADGSSGAASAADIQVTVGGQDRTLVAGNPGADEFQADLLTGTLVFGAALPAQGIVEATYFIGQWERRVSRLRGELTALVLAADAPTVRDLSTSLIAAMGRAPEIIRGLAENAATELGTVALSGKDAVAARQRAVSFHFEYELEIDAPDSSGGIIRQVPITAKLA